MIIFYTILAITVIQRIVELLIASNNEQWMKERSGIEVGNEHYKYFILLHISFFLLFILEVQYNYVTQEKTLFNIYFFIFFVIAQVGRVWCIISLGRFWNTKIIVIPNVILIKKGPYRWLKHPNYVIVFIEFLSLPLVFGAYFVAIVFPLLHLLLLTIRIPIEEKALGRKMDI